jgi:predicted transcriptional regulator
MPLTKFRLRGFQRLSEAVLDSLGELERKVLSHVLKLGETNVTNVCASLDKFYAYTTVMTTLDRLYKKGLLDRHKDGRAYVYSPRYSLEEMERGITADVIDSLLSAMGRPEPILACIVDSVSERDIELLDELERLVKEKKAELNK